MILSINDSPLMAGIKLDFNQKSSDHKDSSASLFVGEIASQESS
jgi:hypothetical protein